GPMPGTVITLRQLSSLFASPDLIGHGFNSLVEPPPVIGKISDDVCHAWRKNVGPLGQDVRQLLAKKPKSLPDHDAAFQKKWVRGEADRHDPTGMSRPQCATNIPMEKEVWSCAKDEGRPLASRDQELDANRCELLPLRAVVVSVAERVGPDPALVRLGETSESKPSMKGRKGI